MLPPYATSANPLDLTGGTMLYNHDAVEQALHLIDDDPETDVIVFVFPLQPDGGTQGIQNLVAAITDIETRLRKPLMIVSTSSATVTDYWAEFSTGVRCPILEDAETAFAAIAGWCG
jgi:acyl-CoA synthetase (NDP forming)